MTRRGMVESTARSWVRRARTGIRRTRYRLAARATRSVRLHLGCGREYWDGYVNVDADPAANSDLCIDFTEIGEAFGDGSIAEVAMIHSLSYLRLWEARDLFRTLVRLMQPGARLIIELPDVSRCARRAIDSEGQLEPYLEALRAMYAFDMDWIARRLVFAPYAFGWSDWHLKMELEQAGFRDVRMCDPQTHGQRLWRDVRIEAIK